MHYKQVNTKLNLLKEYISKYNSIYSRILITSIDKKYISSSFPEFYKIFLEEIGTVYLAHSDQFLFEVTLPKPTKEAWFLEEDFDHNKGLTLIFHTDDVEILYILLDSENNISDLSKVNNSVNINYFSEIICNILDDILDNYNNK